MVDKTLPSLPKRFPIVQAIYLQVFKQKAF